MKMNSKEGVNGGTLTKKELNACFWRNAIAPQTCWNWESQGAPNFACSVYPAMKKIYGDRPEELKTVMHSHFMFYNTNHYLGNITLGAVLAMEENHTEKTREAVTALKSSLMGPLAGVGDSIFWVLPTTILGSMAAYMALEGSALGFLIIAVYVAAILFVRKFLFDMGYKQGTLFVTSLKGYIDNFVQAASMLGMTVIGGLIGSGITCKTGIVFSYGEATASLQDTLDTIMPKLLPVLLVVLCYWLLGKKWMSPAKLVVILVVLGVIGYSLGIFAI